MDLRRLAGLSLLCLYACAGAATNAPPPNDGARQGTMEAFDTGSRQHSRRANGQGGGNAGGRYHCFDVGWSDGRHNSECVPTAEHCERDLESMRGYASPDARFEGCYATDRVFCYLTDGDSPLCFSNADDCESSRSMISGGECSLRE